MQLNSVKGLRANNLLPVRDVKLRHQNMVSQMELRLIEKTPPAWATIAHR